MSNIVGGDEVNALVVDLGTYTCRAGFAGDDTPKAYFPSAVGSLPVSADTNGTSTREGSDAMEVDAAAAASGREGSSNAAATRRLFVGSSDLTHRRDHVEITSPFDEHDLLSDWDAVEALWSHAFRDRLRVDPAEYAMMLAEPSHNSEEVREKTVELMFEKFGPPALFLAKNAVLASFATGRQTSTVVDSGHSSTTVAAVHDGYLLQKSIIRSPVAGRLLTQCMLSSIQAQGVDIRPRWAFKKTERQPGVYQITSLDQPGTTASFRRYAVEAIAADVKESVCRVSENIFVEQDNLNIPTQSYELPDGTEIFVGPDRFKVPEVMFQPQLLGSFPNLPPVKSFEGGELQPLQAMVLDSISRCDVDHRRELYNGIVLTGGNILTTFLKERLERELIELAPTAKVKVIAPGNLTERKFSTWVGGSILASLGSFQQLWMSKAEFEESGASLIHRKAP